MCDDHELTMIIDILRNTRKRNSKGKLVKVHFISINVLVALCQNFRG